MSFGLEQFSKSREIDQAKINEISDNENLLSVNADKRK